MKPKKKKRVCSEGLYVMRDSTGEFYGVSKYSKAVYADFVPVTLTDAKGLYLDLGISLYKLVRVTVKEVGDGK